MKFLSRSIFLAFAILSFNLSFGTTFHGRLLARNADSTLVVASMRGSIPSLSQQVSVISTFDKAGIKDEVTLGRGILLESTADKITIKLIVISGTWMSAEAQPALQSGHFIKLRWEGPGDQIRNEYTEVEGIEEMIRLRQYESANKRVDSLLKVMPTSVGATVAKGRLVFLKKNFSAADSLFSKAIAVAPGYPDVFLFRSLAREKQHKLKEAKADAEAGIQNLSESSTPADSLILLRLHAHLNLLLNDKDGLCKDAKQLIAMNSRDFSYHNFYGFYCVKSDVKSQKKYTEATLLKKDPWKWELKSGGEKGPKYKGSKYALPAAGSILMLEEAKDKLAISTPVFKVVSATSEQLVLEVLYWSGTKEFDPNSHDYIVDKAYKLFW